MFIKNNAVGLAFTSLFSFYLKSMAKMYSEVNILKRKKACWYKIVITVWKAMLTLTNNADHGPIPYIC